MSVLFNESISNSEWVDINTLTSTVIGTPLRIQNSGNYWVNLVESDTQPDPEQEIGIILKGSGEDSVTDLTFAGTKPLWAKSFGLGNATLTIYTGNTFVFGGDLDPRVYTGYQGLTTQPFTEANVKNGTQFTITEEIVIPTGTPIVYRGFKTPNDGRDILVKTRIINTDGGMRYTPHSSQTGVVIGTNKDNFIVNLNSKSSNVSGTSYYDITSVGDEGPFFDVVRSANGNGSNRQQGIFSGLGIERVLDQDTEYLLKFENLDNKEIYIVFSITFYSGPLSVDTI